SSGGRPQRHLDALVSERATGSQTAAGPAGRQAGPVQCALSSAIPSGTTSCWAQRPGSLLLGGGCADGFESLAPADEVIDHRGERSRRDLGRGEGAVGDVGEDRERGLVADDGELVVREDVTQVLGGAHTLVSTVVDDAGDLVVELGGHEVQRVLQRTGDRVVVFGGDEDEGVELVELRT